MLSHIFILLSLPLVSHRYRHEKQDLELSNTLLFQALHLFCFTTNELRRRLWPIDNAHTLYSNTVAESLTTPINMPTTRGLYVLSLHYAWYLYTFHAIVSLSHTVAQDFFVLPPAQWTFTDNTPQCITLFFVNDNAFEGPVPETIRASFVQEGITRETIICIVDDEPGKYNNYSACM